MAFYRNLLTAIVACGLATTVFAADELASNEAQNQAAAQTLQLAENNVQQGTEQPAATQEKKVNVNTATVKELENVKGLSKVKAKNIVSYRKKHGAFKSVDDLSKVRGFKKVDQEKMTAIKDQLTV